MTVTVISTDKLRLRERGLAQGHKARRWRDHSAQYKNPRRLRRDLSPTPPTTWARLRGPRSGRKRCVCGSRTGKSSSFRAEAGPKATAGRAAGTPRGQGLPAPRAARSHSTVRGGGGGAGGGKGSSPAQVPLRERGDGAASNDTRNTAAGCINGKPASRRQAL